MSATELEQYFSNRPDRHDVNNRLDATWTTEYARVRALQFGTATDYEIAANIMTAIAESSGLTALGQHVDLYLQLLMKLRSREAAIRVLAEAEQRLHPENAQAVACDLLNPHLWTESTLDPAAWVESLSTTLLHPNMPALALTDQLGTPFDRLSAPTDRVVHMSHKITVITSAFRPGLEILTTARSLIKQTWQNWEMLVVDDASGPAYEPILAQVASLDSRIRVIRKAINGGTYRARNTALMQAAGEFVVVVDSDDWVHPMYLESGVRPLLDNASLIATRGWGVRITEDLELVRPGYRPLIQSAASLMFRISDAVGRVGFFDPVKKAADTEFARRLEAAFGSKVRDLPRSALTFLRAGEQTLSAGDFSAGWRHSSRRAYRGAYEAWHRQIVERSAEPYLDPDSPRPFPVPRRWSTAQADQICDRPRIDVVFAGDWRRHGGPQNSMFEEIAACRSVGMRVGIMHLEAMRFMTRRDDQLCLAVRELIQSGEVEWVHIDDAVDIGTLLLRYPPILQYPPLVHRAVQPDHLLIVANQAPCEPDGADQRYVPQDVTRNAIGLFGIEPVWAPQGPTVRDMLTQLDPGISLTPWDNPGLIDLDAWHVRPPRPLPTEPVVGRYSRDTEIKFPASIEDLLTAYDMGPDIQVRMMGAVNTVRRLNRKNGNTDEIPPTWTLTKHKAIDTREFLAGLDVFLYLDDPHANEAFGRVILEAAASGVLTIASPKHQRTFGNAVLYAEPEQAAALTKRYLADPALYSEQVERCRSLVHEQFSHRSFLERLRSLNPTIGASDDDIPSETIVDNADGSEQSGWEIHFDPRASWLPPRLVGAPDLTLRSIALRSAGDSERVDFAYVIAATSDADAIAAASVTALARLDAGVQVRPEDLSSPIKSFLVVRGPVIDVVSAHHFEWSDSIDSGGAAVLSLSPGPGPCQHRVDRQAQARHRWSTKFIPA